MAATPFWFGRLFVRTMNVLKNFTSNFRVISRLIQNRLLPRAPCSITAFVSSLLACTTIRSFSAGASVFADWLPVVLLETNDAFERGGYCTKL